MQYNVFAPLKRVEHAVKSISLVSRLAITLAAAAALTGGVASYSADRAVRRSAAEHSASLSTNLTTVQDLLATVQDQEASGLISRQQAQSIALGALRLHWSREPYAVWALDSEGRDLLPTHAPTAARRNLKALAQGQYSESHLYDGSSPHVHVLEASLGFEPWGWALGSRYDMSTVAQQTSQLAWLNSVAMCTLMCSIGFALIALANSTTARATVLRWSGRLGTPAGRVRQAPPNSD